MSDENKESMATASIRIMGTETQVAKAITVIHGIGRYEGYVDVVESYTVSRNDETLNVFRQWFDSVQDTNPSYLKAKDFRLAKKVYETLGMRVPSSIEARCEE